MDAARRIIVPLDVSTTQQALATVRRLKGKVGSFKVGLQLFSAAGPDAVRRILDLGERVFLDLKLHDIPNTVARAASEAASLGVWMMDVHLSGGAPMIAAAARAVRPAASRAGERPLLIGITVLTSLDQGDLASVGVDRPIHDHAVRLARLGLEEGLDGVVASPHEIAGVRAACGEKFLIVTPGIRPRGADAGDQKRFATPREAIAAGADYLVIGRPITEAADPAAAVEAIAREIDA